MISTTNLSPKNKGNRVFIFLDESTPTKPGRGRVIDCQLTNWTADKITVTVPESNAYGKLKKRPRAIDGSIKVTVEPKHVFSRESEAKGYQTRQFKRSESPRSQAPKPVASSTETKDTKLFDDLANANLDPGDEDDDESIH